MASRSVLLGIVPVLNAYTTDHDDVVDQGNAFARLCPGDSTLLARWATADYDKIIIRNTHFVGLRFTMQAALAFPLPDTTTHLCVSRLKLERFAGSLSSVPGF